MKADPNETRNSEDALVRAAQSGDRAAFGELVRFYYDRLYRWLTHLTRDPHSAEDIVQDTFLKAFAALGSFRPGTNFRAWLFRIGHNNFVNHHRGGRQIKLPLSAEIPEERLGPENEVLDRESVRLVIEAIHKLPSQFRAALLLRAEEGLSFKEIAEVLDLTEETARWRVFKARQKLMSVLAPELQPAPPPESK